MAVTYTQIESLVTDSGFQELKYKQEKSNLFSIVGQTHKEQWHSAFISWLLDAHSSLRLGHYPLARLLTLYMVKNPECGYDLADLYRWNLDTVRFQTEKDASMQGKKRSIDVYGESDELIIVIENKVNAHENFNHSDVGQTQDYYDYVQAHKTERQKACYFFITPDPRQKSYADMYERITYQELYDNVIAKCLEHPQLSGDGLKRRWRLRILSFARISMMRIRKCWMRSSMQWMAAIPCKRGEVRKALSMKDIRVCLTRSICLWTRDMGEARSLQLRDR